MRGMENPQGLNVESVKSSVKPIIEYDPNLRKEDVPYDINVNSEKCTELFRELGLSDEAIGRFKIKLKRKPFLRKGPVGSYRPIGGDTITIYTDVLWKKLQAQKEQKPPLRERGTAFLRKVSGGEFGTSVGLFLHESKHASDFKTKAVKILGTAFQFTYYVGGAIGVGIAIDKSIPMAPLNHLLAPLAIFSLPILYPVNPFEIRARKFAVKNRDEAKWQDIMTITPKQKKA